MLDGPPSVLMPWALQTGRVGLTSLINYEPNTGLSWAPRHFCFPAPASPRRCTRRAEAQLAHLLGVVVGGRLLHCNIGEVNIWQRLMVKDKKGVSAPCSPRNQTKALAWDLMGEGYRTVQRSSAWALESDGSRFKSRLCLYWL